MESSEDPGFLTEHDRERRAGEQVPVEESGEGESEGFELAEEELIEHAEGEAGGNPLGDRFPAEETDPAEHTAYGDADEVQSDVDEDTGERT